MEENAILPHLSNPGSIIQNDGEINGEINENVTCNI